MLYRIMEVSVDGAAFIPTEETKRAAYPTPAEYLSLDAAITAAKARKARFPQCVYLVKRYFPSVYREDPPVYEV